MTQSEMEIKLAVLDSENKTINAVLNRFDIAVDKLVEATTTIKELLAAHDTRIQLQHLDITNLQHTTDQIDGDLQEILKTIQEDHKILKSRVDALETWRWLIIGAATVVGFVINWIANYVSSH